jgi:MORN repeat
MKDGKMHGKGSLHYKVYGAGTYEGDFVDGKQMLFGSMKTKV